MKIYNYDEINKEFISEGEATKSPLEEGVYLIPANATSIEPIAFKKGYAVCFNENKEIWEYIKDNRGKTAYLTSTKEEIKINYLGDIKNVYTFLKPNEFDFWNGAAWEVDLPLLKNQKINEINSLCEKEIINGFTSNALISKHYYKSTLEDQINLQSAVLSALDVKIKCSIDNKKWEYKLHNKEQVKALLKDFEMFKDNLLIKADAFKNVVNNSLDAKDLENINF